MERPDDKKQVIVIEGIHKPNPNPRLFRFFSGVDIADSFSKCIVEGTPCKTKGFIFEPSTLVSMCLDKIEKVRDEEKRASCMDFIIESQVTKSAMIKLTFKVLKMLKRHWKREYIKGSWYVYGGCIRDILASKLCDKDLDTRVRDIDIFVDCDDGQSFIEDLVRGFTVFQDSFKCKVEIYFSGVPFNHYGKGTYKLYLQCVKSYNRYEEYDEDARRTTLKFDITIGSKSCFSCADFDVNSLFCSRLPDRKLKVSSYWELPVLDVLNRISRGEFIVLSNTCRAIVKHEKVWIRPVFDDNGSIIGFKRVSDSDSECDCISRCTEKGKKIMERIVKMKLRGWKCANKGCYNPECILAKPRLVSLYERFKRLNGSL